MSQRFTTKVTQKPTGKGTWDKQIVEIFDNGVKCGEYEYGYSSGSNSIFQPFEQDGQWYATYVDKDYTNLKIMTLPDCKFYCAADSWYQFCPAEVYIPQYIRAYYRVDITKDNRQKDIGPDGKFKSNYWWLNDEKTDSRLLYDDYDYHEIIESFLESDSKIKDFDFNNDDHVKEIIDYINDFHINLNYIDCKIDPIAYHDKIFISGCVWACPYEIRCIDVSDLKNKKSAKLDYMCVCDDNASIPGTPKGLKNRIRMHDSRGFLVLCEEFKEYNDMIKQTEEWKERVNARKKESTK